MSTQDRPKSKPFLRYRNGKILFAASILLQCIALGVLSFRGYDTYSHIFWIGEWHRLWNAGIVYPHWLPDSFRGFGAPSFYFYPPLTFFLTSALYAVLPNFSPESIGKTLGLLALATSGLSVWLYLRWRHPDRRGSQAQVFAALLYMFAPYRFFDYSVRGAISEHVALIFVPLVFWGIDLFAERRSPRDIRRGMALLILSLALLFLSNLPTAAVTGLGAVVYVVAQEKKWRLSLLGKLASAAIAAGFLTAFYLLPVAALFNDVQFGRLWLPVSILQSSPFLALFSGADLMINSYILLSLAGGCILLIGYWRRQKDEQTLIRHTEFWVLILIVFVQLPFVSQFLFQHVPPFTVIQLSYRFNILLLVVVAVAWANEMDMLKNTAHPRTLRRSLASGVVMLWSLGTIGLVTLQMADVHVHPHDLLPIGEAPEYAPRWSRPYYDFGASLSAPFANDSEYVIWRGMSSNTVIRDTRHPYSDSIVYRAAEAGSLLLRRSYWPTWEASLDGEHLSPAPDSLGRLAITVPAGSHHLIITLAPEPSARIGAWISIFSLFALIVRWKVIPKTKSGS